MNNKPDGATTEDHDMRSRWEERARDKGDDFAGVLFQGLPQTVNRAIHNWHTGLILRYFLPLIPEGGHLLDMGCGYGRLSREVLRHRSDVHIIGTDFSLEYGRIFATSTHAPAVCGCLQSPPFANGAFDALLAITALMYVEPAAHKKVMNGLLALLRPGGVAFFLDPGKEFMQLASWLHPSSRHKTTGGTGFTARYYRQLASPHQVVKIGGATLLTMFLPVALALGKFPGGQSRLLARLVSCDTGMGWHSFWDLHRWMVVRKVE